jgi:hypothetical protein
MRGDIYAPWVLVRKKIAMPKLQLFVMSLGVCLILHGYDDSVMLKKINGFAGSNAAPHSILLCSCISWRQHCASPFTQTTIKINPVFVPILPLLRQRTHVPLRLPTYLAAEGEGRQLYAIVEQVTFSRYEIQLAFTKDCTGGNACRYGMISGHVAKGARRVKGKVVRLDRGIVGRFVDAVCGAVCSDSTLTWDQDGYRYTVGIKAADMGTLMKVANSAINNKPVVP